MKKIIFFFIVLISALPAYTQNKLGDAINIVLQFRGGATYNTDVKSEAIGFMIEDFKISLDGNIGKNIYYKYQHNIAPYGADIRTRENISNNVLVAGIGIKSGKFDIFTGKQLLSHGGIEYYYSTVDVYQFSELINYTSCYHTGVSIAYNFNKNQQLKFQIANAYPLNFNDMFGVVPLSIEKALLPLSYVANYNATFFEKYNIRSSVSASQVANNKYNYLFALGNEFKISSKLNLYADFYYAVEGIDSKGQLSMLSRVASPDMYTALNAKYRAIVARINYNVCSNFKLLLKASYDTAELSKDNDILLRDRYITTIGYMAGVEYQPFTETPVKIFMNYRGKNIKYNDIANNLGFNNRDENSIWLGVICRFSVL